MGFFGKLFKKEEAVKIPRGFHSVTVLQINRLTRDAVEIVFDIPQELQSTFSFTPGQYLSVSIELNGKEERRSYSICSEKGKPLAIAVKEVENGKVSTWVNRTLQVGNAVLISKPEGRFVLNGAKKIVAIAAGSGITPIMSMAAAIEQTADASMKLIFANKTEADILFRERLDKLTKTEKRYFLTQEEKAGFNFGRITKDAFMAIIKEDLGVLRSDGFYICGPEEMIHSVKTALELFGVAEDKIHFELFTTVTATESAPPALDFKGTVKVKVLLDDETFDFQMNSTKTILDAASSEEVDAPYSCRGGVCSTCRAKVLKGTVKMNLNYTLTDKEVEQGYILTCQSYPTSEELIISYDE